MYQIFIKCEIGVLFKISPGKRFMADFHLQLYIKRIILHTGLPLQYEHMYASQHGLRSVMHTITEDAHM